MENGNPVGQQPDTIESLMAKVEELTKSNATLEKRFKDTQAAYTKGQQQLKAFEAQNKVLQEQLTVNVVDTPEMNELKEIDPEAWYQKRRQLEIEANTNFNQKLAQAAADAQQQVINAQNEALLAEFKAQNPNITEEFINNEVPVGLKKKLDKGEITFADFLTKVRSLAQNGVTYGGGHQTLNQPNLSSMGNAEGTTNKLADANDLVKLYRNQVI